MTNVQYCVAAVGPSGGLVAGYFFYPLTEEGLKRAKDKRSELMAKYLHAQVKLFKSEW